MKIVCLSDTHCQLDAIKVPDGDVLVHAGDLTWRGDEREMSTELRLLGQLPHLKKIYVAGNHDWLAQRRRSYVEQMCADHDIIYLEDSGVVIDGIRFWGSPWQPEFGNWAFNINRMRQGEGSLSEKWELIPDQTDVLITHGPPLHVGDQTKSHSGMPIEDVGCYDLAQRVRRLQLKLHVFGHIHPSYGVYKNQPLAPNTVFVNASNCDEHYDPKHPPIVVDL